MDTEQIEKRLTTKIPCSIEISVGDGGQIERVTFDQDIITIGRDNKCDLVVNNLGASRFHAQIERYASFYILRDSDSKTGTFVSGNKIEEEYNLNNNDKIFLAKHTLLFKVDNYFNTRKPQKKIDDKDLMKQTLAISYDTMATKNVNQAAYLFIAEDKKNIPLHKNVTFFGKSNKSDFEITGMLISERHVAIVREDKNYYIYHLGAFKPPLVNKQNVDFAPLKHGDTIQIGDLNFQFRLPTK